MLKIIMDDRHITVAVNGPLDLIVAELLHGISTIYARAGAILGDDAAETFRQMVAVGVAAPDSPVWEKDKDKGGTSVSFGPQAEEEG